MKERGREGWVSYMRANMRLFLFTPMLPPSFHKKQNTYSNRKNLQTKNSSSKKAVQLKKFEHIFAF